MTLRVARSYRPRAWASTLQHASELHSNFCVGWSTHSEDKMTAFLQAIELISWPSRLIWYMSRDLKKPVYMRWKGWPEQWQDPSSDILSVGTNKTEPEIDCILQKHGRLPLKTSIAAAGRYSVDPDQQLEVCHPCAPSLNKNFVHLLKKHVGLQNLHFDVRSMPLTYAYLAAQPRTSFPLFRP